MPTGPDAILLRVANPRIAKWTRWVDAPRNEGGGMKDDILGMHLRRDTWEQVQAMLRGRDDLPESYWWRFMFDTYVEAQGAAVRRQVYADSDANSLGRLLLEMSRDAALVTRDWWMGMRTDADSTDMRDEIDRLVANREWSEHFAGIVGDNLDPAIPTADLEALRNDSERVITCVDRRVAHSDKRAIPADDMPTLDDVHAAIGRIGEIYNRYYGLLTASSWAELVPAIQHDWMAVFRVPWARPS
jgi:hypothetical protein